MNNKENTQHIAQLKDNTIDVTQIIGQVYEALTEKGYNPVSQLVGYIMSGDPTYITSHNNARSMIRRIDRDEILEEFVRYYLRSCDKQ